MFRIFFVFLSLLTLSASAQKKFGCINEKGEILFRIEAEHVSDFSGGMAQVQMLSNNQWRYGYIDTTGKLVIQAQFEKASDFRDGVAWIKVPGGDFQLINKSGKIISKKSYKKVGIFFEGMCSVYEGLNMGFVNALGEEVIPCKYAGDPAFSEGLVCVTLAEGTEEKYGFLNTKGEVVIPFKFKQGGFSSFRNGEARMQVNGKTCLINTKGEVVFTPKLTTNMEHFTNGLSLAYTKPNRKGFGFFNRNNQWMVRPIYDHATSFENGFSVVEMNGQKGVIDTNGRTIIPLRFQSIYANAITDGYFACEKDGKREYLNAKGLPVTKVAVDYLLSAKGHQLMPYKSSEKGKMGYLNRNGEIAIQAEFEKAASFKEGKAWVRF